MALSDKKYQLISGERRLRAIIEIGITEITAYILEHVDDEAMLAMALIENIQREQLNPIEIGYAYKRLMDECNLTQDQIAERVGKDRTTVANSIRLLKLPVEIQECLSKGDISMGHARPLINISNVSLQLEILRKILSENLSVRKVEQMVKDAMLDAKQKTHKPVRVSSAVSLQNANMQSFEDSLRRILGTKVICNQKKDGKGEIVIEYYSSDEFERVFELLYAINQNG
ncbi:MAG: ParB/RepB/Spo0J family partition protein [Ignavibacteriales bacterium]|nr:ParB/RepB/Spo0J family partition protein [Ignavibacteriales bacterium]